MGKTTNDILLCSEKALENDEKEYKNILNSIKNYSLDITKEVLGNFENSIEKKMNNIFFEIDMICKGIFYLKDISEKTRDKLVSYGEIISTTIIFEYFLKKYPHIKVSLLDTRKFVKTDSNYGNAAPNFIQTDKKINDFYKKNCDIDLFIVTGFISSDIDNNVTTLGRGGGDYTAAIFGHCLNSEIVEIWSDVNGIMSSDPRKVNKAFNIPKISYQEMLNLSHYGANVVYTPTIMPLYKKKIPILIKNSDFPENPGTEIHYDSQDRDSIATAIATIENIALLKIYGEYLIGNIGFSGKLFSKFSISNINITMIAQSSSEHSIYLVIYQKDLHKASKMLNNYYEKNIENKTLNVEYYIDKSVISVITSNQKNILKISNIIFPILNKKNINIYTQTTSDKNISLIIDRKNIHNSLNIIHNSIFTTGNKNIFIIGTGLVGNELIKQIQLIENCNIILIANSKKYIINLNGIKCNFKQKLEKGKENDIQTIINEILNLNLPNGIFIDCTSSDKIFPFYKILLDNNISVVTPNKKANTTNYNTYNELIKFNNYKFETTVGAGLPIVHTVNNIRNSGDKVLKIEAILSGSLSYIFTSFMNNNKKFSEIVKNAQELGYTEPNPKDDLIGTDVQRKILIIMRLLGFKFEMENIINDSFLSEKCLNSKNKEEFLYNLESMNNIMENKKINAQNNLKKIKHIAIFEEGKASIKLKEIDNKHPFYDLSGSDNMIIITTKYYEKNPLIIRGPGAGAEVTAAGIISDIFNII